MLVTRFLSSRAAAVATLAAVLVVVSLASQSGAAVDKDDVRVINTSAEAVPVALDPTANIVQLDDTSNVVRHGDDTETLAADSVHFNLPGSNQSWETDVSPYEKVRIMGIASCGQLTFQVDTNMFADRYFELDRFELGAGAPSQMVNKMYEVPGRTMMFSVSSGSGNCDFEYALFGRRN